MMATLLARKLAGTFLTIAVLLGLIPPVVAQEKISLSYSALSPSTAFLWIPREKGFFKKHGLDAEIILIESGTLTSQALASGEIGIADNAGAPAIISNASGSGEMIIMGLVNSLEYNMVSTKQVKDLTDLKGKRIGVSRIGSSSHAAVEIALDHFKLDAKRDAITFVQSGTMTTRVAGLRAGSIDATVVDPAFVPFMLKEGYKDLGYLGKFGIPYQHESLDSSKAYLAKHRDTALKAVKGIIEGIAFIAQERNASDVKRVLGKYLKFDDPAKTEDAYKSLKGYALNIRKPYPTNEGVNSLINFLAKFNPKVAKVTVQDVVDASLVGELDRTGFIDAVYKEMAQGK
ncbi:MAG TPA: ABC transporter substrate-binding protein [Candidatus Udaeobacter sp.]|jgi:NitT/TauT family transport system substrate-binding protein|nr:ABC transporter substrate-binding protein [Candidatus Udaeobacter sp.]